MVSYWHDPTLFTNNCVADIDFTVAAMRLLPQEGVAEGVDYETPESEMEHYHDSIEDNFGSCSESNYSDEQ